jgi:hypothetical protein
MVVNSQDARRQVKTNTTKLQSKSKKYTHFILYFYGIDATVKSSRETGQA